MKQLASFYKVPTERIVAVHDELDLPFDTMRVKLGGGDNGHNGVRSMRAALGTGDFYRVRIGIGRPTGRQDVADFVLSNYSATERKALPLQVVTRRRRGRVPGDRRARGDPVDGSTPDVPLARRGDISWSVGVISRDLRPGLALSSLLP